MNQSRSVVVLGAGIVGVSTALWLQRAGYRVVLVDRQGPAAGTSHGNAGVLAACSVVPVTVPGLLRKAPGMLLHRNSPLFLRWRYLPRMAPWLFRYLSHCDPAEVQRIATALAPLTRTTLADHRALAAGTNARQWIEPADYVFAYQDKAHFDADCFGWQIREDLGFRWIEQDTTAFHTAEPVFGSRVGYGVRVPEHGRITDPGAYVRALADHVIAGGGELQLGDVRRINVLGDRFDGIALDDRVIRADHLVVATGVWSGPLAEQLGVRVPMESERGYHLELWGADRMPTDPVMLAAYKVVATPMQGRLRLAGAVEFGGLHAPASAPPFDMLLDAVGRIFPGIQYSRVEQWMGHRPAPADSIPVIGPSPRVRGAWLGFGHHHIGLTTGALTGRMLAQMIHGEPTSIDPTPYDPARFAIGAPRPSQ